MKQLKRIAFIGSLLVILIPINVFAEVISSPKPYDYTDGLLDDPRIIKGINLNPAQYDNNLDTNSSATNFNSIEFKVPVNLEQVYIKNRGYRTSKFTIYFYDDKTNKLKSQEYSPGSEGYYDLKRDNVIKITGKTNLSHGIYQIEFFGSYDLDYFPPPPGEVKDVVIKTTLDSATITYTEPKDEEISHVNIYVGGEKYEGINGKAILSDLSPGTNYEITLKSVDNYGSESEGITEKFKTDDKPPETAEELPEVENLEIEATDERADLSWDNPPQFFDKAKIYRKDLGTKMAFNINPFSPMTVHAAEEYKPLFETNGTEFSDLSIEQETEYEYKVTTVYDGMESNGTIVKTTIPKTPLFDLSETKLPFDVMDLIKSGNGLLLLIGGFLLLALSFIFVPKVVSMIRESMKNGGSGKGDGSQGKESRSVRMKAAREREIKAPRASKAPRESTKAMRQSARMPRETREPRTGRG